MKKISLLFFLFIFASNPTYSQDTLNVPTDYTTIQAAIDAAADGDIVLVADGIYYENIYYNGKAITIASHFLIDSDTSHISSTIIDGSQAVNPDNGAVVYFASGEDTNSVLCGFTITGGFSAVGGGIRCFFSGGKIIHNKIINNSSGARLGGGGGGIGALDTSQSNIVIEYNEILNNYAGGYGGAGGGGIFIYGLNAKICNNLISQNNTHYQGNGGGINIFSSQSIIISNTVVNNNTGLKGGGIALYSESVIFNNIIWGNTAQSDSQIYDYTGNLDVFFSDIQGGWSGIGNINVYPEYVDTANGDFHLANNSPCIGAGIDSLKIAGIWYYCPLTDLEGNPRPNPVGTMPDMGAYENGPMVGVEEDILTMNPGSFSLSQNFPNPFNPSTKIRYSVPQLSNVVIKVYDILGNEIETLVNEEKQTGTYDITWNASGVSAKGGYASGIYFYQLKAGNYLETKKMMLTK